MPSGDQKMLATVKVRISPTFWGWVFQFGKQMKVLSPENVVEESRQKIRILSE